MVIAGLSGCGESAFVTAPIEDEHYPTVIESLAPAELQARRTQFRQLNPRICGDLNVYGLTEGMFAGQCLRNVAISIPDPENAEHYIENMRQTLYENRMFSGVTDPDAPIIRRYVFQGGTNTARRIAVSFKNQVYEGMEVLRTPMGVVIDRRGVISIDGYHFESIHIPERYHHHSVVRGVLVGQELHWWGWTGPNTTIITEDSFTGTPVLAIWPLQVEDRIELRVAWQFRVEPRGLWWDAYVDVITTEFLGTVQLFVE
jgi:hypothetical protein